MDKTINLLDFPILYGMPPQLSSESRRIELIPFCMFLIQALTPRMVVDAGDWSDGAYTACCYAMRELKLPARSFARAGSCPEKAADAENDIRLREAHEALYGHFSTFLPKPPREMREMFEAESIDLLLLDPLPTPEAVREDVEAWMPRLSTHGILLFRDTNVLDRHCGTRIIFDELKTRYPHFELLHGNGMGIVAIGGRQTAEIQAFLEADEASTLAIRRHFFHFGQRVRLEIGNADLNRRLERFNQGLIERDGLIRALQQQITDREISERNLHRQIHLITSSKGWALLQFLWGLRFWRSESVDRSVTAPVEVPEKSPGDSLQAPLEPTQTMKAASILQTEAEGAAGFPPAYNTEQIHELVARNRNTLEGLSTGNLRCIAFYLPQFHPIPENDRWWGPGFTEWNNVLRGRPVFNGHYQPHLPADLGFYDLRLPEIREAQADMARDYGLDGFCYHHYWFGGKRLLERPFQEVLRSGRPGFPFCLCWANENWTRRWDGSEHEILMAQDHSDADDRNFIRDLFPAFEDARYIRVGEKPLLIVYRVNILPDAARTARIWREEAHKAGIGELYLCAAQSFGIVDPRPYGFDAAVEFPPHSIEAPFENERIKDLDPAFRGPIHDYMLSANRFLNRPTPEYVLFKTVFPSWDNTARRRNHGTIFHHASPAAYEYWLGKAVELTARTNCIEEQIVFINAWNEWGEGAHLEPDQRFGRRFLESTRNVLSLLRARESASRHA